LEVEVRSVVCKWGEQGGVGEKGDE
jgi:hypothetical protein